MTIEVRRAGIPAERKAFINLPYKAYRHDPHWRAPLRIERRDHFDPRHNEALGALDPAFFLAWRDGVPVGRVAAFVNSAHVERHGEATGHFGFLDTVGRDDDEAVSALLGAAEAELKARGMTKIAGPYNFSVNDECGLPIKGFDTPPSVMMPYGRPEMPAHVEACGYHKAMDLHALRCVMGDDFQRPPMVAKLQQRFDEDPGLTVRPLEMSNIVEDIALVVDIFNDAWSDNWGFIPISDREAVLLAESMKLVLSSHSLWISMVDGMPASFTLMIPNLNEAAHGLDGRLLPFGWAHLLYRLKISGVKSARVPLAGTRKIFHKSRRGLAVTTGAWNACLEAQHARGIREVEWSWVLETNKDLLGLSRLYECDHYKTYRIYEKAL